MSPSPWRWAAQATIAALPIAATAGGKASTCAPAAPATRRWPAPRRGGGGRRRLAQADPGPGAGVAAEARAVVDEGHDGPARDGRGDRGAHLLHAVPDGGVGGHGGPERRAVVGRARDVDALATGAVVAPRHPHGAVGPDRHRRPPADPGRQ